MIPYPAYKSTNLPWLPKTPEHWTVNKVRHFYHSILGKMLASSQTDSTYTYEKYLCAKDVHFSGVDLSDLKEMWFSPEEKKKYQIKTGDLLVVEGGAGAGGAAIFKGFGESLYIQNSIHRVRPKTDNVTVQFLYYWLCAFVRRKYVDYACNKATIPHFTGDKLSEMPFVLAPFAEQEQIVRYLDSMTAKINKLIRAKKKQIALLQEQRQAIINQAVTKGLDPNVEMKDSGIDWIGRIPKHWILNKVGHFYKSILGKMLANTPSSPQDSFEKYLCAKDVHFNGVDLTDLKQMWFSPEEKIKYQVKPGDLLVVEGGAGAGGAAVFHGFSENLYVQNSIHIVRPKQGNTTVQYLYYWICALVGRKYIDYACNKATIPHFTGDKLFEMPFVLAPLAEQKAIVDHLVNICRKYDSIIDKLNNEINLTVEYKNSLISSVVTGQIDVRNISMEDVIPDDLIPDDDPPSEIEEEPPTPEESEE